MTLQQLKAHIQKLIGIGQTGKALEDLANALDPERPVFDTLIQLRARFNDTFREEMHQTITRYQARLEYAQVSEALLRLLGQLSDDDLGAGGSLEDPLDAFV